MYHLIPGKHASNQSLLVCNLVVSEGLKCNLHSGNRFQKEDVRYV